MICHFCKKPIDESKWYYGKSINPKTGFPYRQCRSCRCKDKWKELLSSKNSSDPIDDRFEILDL